MSDEKVLIIEDNKEIAEIVAMNIRDIGLETEHTTDGKEGLTWALSGKYALIIIDIMLPSLDGISICKKIRENNHSVPILILTAKDNEIDRVLGLELGADDYMSKPFSIRELIARVKALLRRSQTEHKSHQKEEPISIGNLNLDLEKHKVTLNQKVIELTVKEFELLELFMNNPGRTYSRADLLSLIWGYQFEGYEHTVNTHINRLRNKIESDPADPIYLKTVWGIGYKFAEKSDFKVGL